MLVYSNHQNRDVCVAQNKHTHIQELSIKIANNGLTVVFRHPTLQSQTIYYIKFIKQMCSKIVAFRCFESSQCLASPLQKNSNTIVFFDALTFFSPVSSNFEKSHLENIKSNYSMNVSTKSWWKRQVRWGQKAASNRCRYSFWCHWKPPTLIELRFLFPSIVRCAIDKSSIIIVSVPVCTSLVGMYVVRCARVCVCVRF